jgi:protein TonB
VRAWVLAILGAIVLHGLILLFGGVFFMKPKEGAAQKVEEVDLLAATEETPEKVEEVEDEPQPADIEVRQEAPPEMAEVTEPAPRIEPQDLVSRLDALSLGALEAALDPAGGGDAFGIGGGGSLASGGRIGGTGAPGLAAGFEDPADAVFDIGSLDQKPRVVFQPNPVYPYELRRRKVEGTVYVVFVVDENGRVIQPSIETASNEAFGAPTLDAVKRWRFDPGVIRGEKVRSKMRVPVRFTLGS